MLSSVLRLLVFYLELSLYFPVLYFYLKNQVGIKALAGSDMSWDVFVFEGWA